MVDAVECALAIQREMKSRNAEIPEDRRIELRIGIHLGDIIVEDGDIYGDGVNIAARIERAGRAGRRRGVGSGRNRSATGSRSGSRTWASITLKNIAQPVHVYNVGSAPTAAAQGVDHAGGRRRRSTTSHRSRSSRSTT